MTHFFIECIYCNTELGHPEDDELSGVCMSCRGAAEPEDEPDAAPECESTGMHRWVNRLGSGGHYCLYCGMLRPQPRATYAPIPRVNMICLEHGHEWASNSTGEFHVCRRCNIARHGRL